MESLSTDANDVYDTSYNLTYSDFELDYAAPWAQIISGAIIAALTILGNSVLVLSILLNCWHRASQFNLHVVSLSLSHLLVGAFVLPFELDTLIWNKFRFGGEFCKAWWLVTLINRTASLFILLSLALDRFLRVLGHTFAGAASKVAGVLLLLLPWLLACALILPWLLHSSTFFETGHELCSLTLPSSHYVILSIVTFFVPGFFLVLLDLGSVLCWTCSSGSRLRDRDAPDVTKMKWQLIAMTTVSFVTLILGSPLMVITLSYYLSTFRAAYLAYVITTCVYNSSSAFIPLVWLIYPDVRMAVKDLVHCRLS